jgi:type II secretory pathway component PulF
VEEEWREPPQMFTQRKNVMDVFNGMNPVAILLVGIVIGVIVVSMRPIVIQATKA